MTVSFNFLSDCFKCCFPKRSDSHDLTDTLPLPKNPTPPFARPIAPLVPPVNTDIERAGGDPANPPSSGSEEDFVHVDDAGYENINLSHEDKLRMMQNKL